MIRKTSETRALAGNIVNEYADSQTSAYSTEYANKAFGGKILWTNPNPTSEFAAQNIVLSSSDYDMYEIVYEGYINGLTYYNSGKIPKGKGTALMTVGGDTSNGPYVYNRVINYTNDTTLAADVCKQSYSSTSVTLNTLNIPIYVIGYKTGIFN